MCSYLKGWWWASNSSVVQLTIICSAISSSSTQYCMYSVLNPSILQAKIDWVKLTLPTALWAILKQFTLSQHIPYTCSSNTCTCLYPWVQGLKAMWASLQKARTCITNSYECPLWLWKCMGFYVLHFTVCGLAHLVIEKLRQALKQWRGLDLEARGVRTRPHQRLPWTRACQGCWEQVNDQYPIRGFVWGPAWRIRECLEWLHTYINVLDTM